MITHSPHTSQANPKINLSDPRFSDLDAPRKRRSMHPDFDYISNTEYETLCVLYTFCNNPGGSWQSRERIGMEIDRTTRTVTTTTNTLRDYKFIDKSQRHYKDMVTYKILKDNIPNDLRCALFRDGLTSEQREMHAVTGLFIPNHRNTARAASFNLNFTQYINKFIYKSNTIKSINKEDSLSPSKDTRGHKKISQELATTSQGDHLIAFSKKSEKQLLQSEKTNTRTVYPVREYVTTVLNATNPNKEAPKTNENELKPTGIPIEHKRLTRGNSEVVDSIIRGLQSAIPKRERKWLRTQSTQEKVCLTAFSKKSEEMPKATEEKPPVVVYVPLDISSFDVIGLRSKMAQEYELDEANALLLEAFPLEALVYVYGCSSGKKGISPIITYGGDYCKKNGIDFMAALSTCYKKIRLLKLEKPTPYTKKAQ